MAGAPPTLRRSPPFLRQRTPSPGTLDQGTPPSPVSSGGRRPRNRRTGRAPPLRAHSGGQVQTAVLEKIALHCRWSSCFSTHVAPPAHFLRATVAVREGEARNGRDAAGN